jgi:hypothetical protein
MSNPWQALAFALEKYPEKVQVTPVDQLLMESARQNDRRPAYLKLAVPDELVKSLRGAPDKRHDLLLLVSIPKEVQQRSESRIILPGEA